MSFKEVSLLRKSGKLPEALELALNDDAESYDRWSATSLFWVYYSISKADNATSFGPWWEIGSEMLSLEQRMDSDDIVAQCLNAALVHISSQCSKECQCTSHVASEEELDFTDRAMKRFPNNMFLLRSHAIVLRSRGDNSGALELFRKVLKMRNESYLWVELYDFIEDDNVRKSALCKALLAQPKSEFTGKIRLKLACVLIRAKDYPHAAYELKVYYDTYRRNSWHPSAEYAQIMKFIPSGTVPQETGPTFYSKHTSDAENFVYADSPLTVMIPLTIRDGKSRDGRNVARVVMVDRKGRGMTVPLSKLGVDACDCMTKAYELRIVKPASGPRQIVSCSVIDSVPEWKADIRIFPGRVKIKADYNGNHFCQIGECRVSYPIVSRLQDGTDVKLVGVRKNGKWRATYIL